MVTRIGRCLVIQRKRSSRKKLIDDALQDAENNVGDADDVAPLALIDMDVAEEAHEDYRPAHLNDWTVHWSPPWAHGSGQRRGYVKCRNTSDHGHKCYRYTQAKDHESLSHCVAYLVSWARLGEGLGLTREEHQSPECRLAIEDVEACVGEVKL